MATQPKDADRAHFRYEPSYPPTIPPGMTVAAYRRRRPRGGRPRPRRRRH